MTSADNLYMFKHLLLECEEGMSGASPIDATLHTTAPSVDNAKGPSGKDFAELLGEGSSTRSGDAIVAHAYPESPSVGTGPQSGPMPTSSELAASIPRLKTPAPEIMERYTPKTLGSYESDVPGIGDQSGVARKIKKCSPRLKINRTRMFLLFRFGWNRNQIIERRQL